MSSYSSEQKIMNNKLFVDYMNKIKDLDDRNYLFSLITYYISPTIAGYKPSTILTLRELTFGNSKRELHKLWNLYKSILFEEYKIEFLEIQKTGDSVVILFYNEKTLMYTFFDKANLVFLQNFGYRSNMTINESLEHLKERFKNGCPHEIGIFLGFPIEDVKVFIEDPSRECLLCGYWRVYTNLEKAKIKFFKYDMVRKYVLTSFIKGKKPSF